MAAVRLLLERPALPGEARDHMMTLAGGTPLLALDMYEHAYAIDYGAKAADYVEAYKRALNWTAADRRFEAAHGAGW